MFKILKIFRLKRRKIKNPKKIGIDIGRIIIGGDTNEENPIFVTENYLNAPQVVDSFYSVKTIIEKFGQINVFLVSKCGEKNRKKVLNG